MIDELFLNDWNCIIRFHIEQSTRISALEKQVEDLEIEIKEGMLLVGGSTVSCDK